MSNKHAYLIMAHHKPDVLQALLTAIDDPRNDIYLHIDKKAKKDMDSANFSVTKSRLHILPAMNVNWAGYSQVACTLALLQAATAEVHSYYHLLTGATYPLKSQEEIHSFFEQIQGQEVIAYDDPRSQDRVRYYHLFSEAGKKRTHGYRALLCGAAVKVQALLGVDRWTSGGLEYKKGFAYWSITHDLAVYVLSQEALIERCFRYSVCPDESFLQVLAYNSNFRHRIWQESLTGQSLRLTTWFLESQGMVRQDHQFLLEDLPMLRDTKALFGLKFDGPAGMTLIHELQESHHV